MHTVMADKLSSRLAELGVPVEVAKDKVINRFYFNRFIMVVLTTTYPPHGMFPTCISMHGPRTKIGRGLKQVIAKHGQWV